MSVPILADECITQGIEDVLRPLEPGGEVAACRAHYPKVAGSTPAPANLMNGESDGSEHAGCNRSYSRKVRRLEQEPELLATTGDSPAHCGRVHSPQHQDSINHHTLGCTSRHAAYTGCIAGVCIVVVGMYFVARWLG